MLRVDPRTRYLMQKTTSSRCESNLLTKSLFQLPMRTRNDRRSILLTRYLIQQDLGSVNRLHSRASQLSYDSRLGPRSGSARVLASPSIDTKAVLSINVPSSLRQLPLARQTDHSLVEPPSSSKKKKQKTSGLTTMASHQSPHCAQYSAGQENVLANLNT
ncbi:hypothetical protein F2Q69_00023372 [Brassica cretica]|uniref:Uncharacterized protein n=1 Tax=Brassica cretica TaxID=69181 RepID=A0A8S9Q2C4_BRACR|nr:hypothetical protein F2Q69_00023372 [Brassica cretica]